MPLAVAGSLFVVSTLPSDAVTLLNTADPTANTNAPTGALAGSGWQYEGQFGPFLGTAISPHHFLTVKHIGVASNVFVYEGINYTVTGYIDDPGSELRIFEVLETLPSYAPLYSRTDELNRGLVVIGRGTERGDPVYEQGRLSGWSWGQTDMVQRWGENRVSDAYGYILFAAFDQNGGLNEAHLSSGDSGGAVFINDAGIWKLAGISFSVDGPFSTTPTGVGFNATLFDVRGFYDCAGRLISGATPIPSGFYALRVSAQLPWIQSVISPGATPTPTPSPTPTSTPSPNPIQAPPATGPGRVISPAPGSTLPSSIVTFSWSTGSANSYILLVGTSPGSSNIYMSGKLSVHSITLQALPTDGSAIYVRLRSRIKKKWQFIDYVYHAYAYDPFASPGAIQSR